MNKEFLKWWKEKSEWYDEREEGLAEQVLA